MRLGLLHASGLALVLAGSVSGAGSRTAAEFNRLGTQFLQEGSYTRALGQFRAAAQLRPADPAIQFNVGLTLFRLGRFRDAIKPLGASLTHPPSARQARYLRGVSYFNLGEFTACAREVETLASDPDHGEHVLYMLVEAYRNSNNERRSRDAFVELDARYPESAFLNRLRGVAYDWEGDSGRAMEEFQQALHKNPRMPEMAFAIGYLYFKQKQYEEAQPWFERELKGDPCYSKASNYLGDLKFSLQKWTESAAHYRTAIACDPAYGDPYIGLGKVLEQRGQLRPALRMYREGVRLKPRDRRGRYALAVALRRLGRTAESQAEFAVFQELADEESKRIPLFGQPQN